MNDDKFELLKNATSEIAKVYAELSSNISRHVNCPSEDSMNNIKECMQKLHNQCKIFLDVKVSE